MNGDYFDIYFRDIVKQARGLTKKLKALDSNHHCTVNPISVYGELPVSLPNNHTLVELFTKEFGEKITVTRIDAEESCIKAFVELKEDKNSKNYREIYLTKGNACWSRFFLCKELSQVLIYNKANATSSLDDIQDLFSHLLNNINDGGKYAQISADNVTYFAAIEFLLPSDIIEELLQAKKNGHSNLDIAQKMLVPEKIVDFRLSPKGQKLFNIKPHETFA